MTHLLNVTLGAAQQGTDQFSVQCRVVRIVERRSRVTFGLEALDQWARLGLLADTIAAVDDEDAAGLCGWRGKLSGSRHGLGHIVVLHGRQQ